MYEELRKKIKIELSYLVLWRKHSLSYVYDEYHKYRNHFLANAAKNEMEGFFREKDDTLEESFMYELSWITRDCERMHIGYSPIHIDLEEDIFTKIEDDMMNLWNFLLEMMEKFGIPVTDIPVEAFDMEFVVTMLEDFLFTFSTDSKDMRTAFFEYWKSKQWKDVVTKLMFSSVC